MFKFMRVCISLAKFLELHFDWVHKKRQRLPSYRSQNEIVFRKKTLTNRSKQTLLNEKINKKKKLENIAVGMMYNCVYI